MRLSRIVLARGNQKVVLRGMVHVGPSAMYSFISAEMDDEVQKGAKVLFEGVNRKPIGRELWLREEKIVRIVLRWMMGIYPLLADALGFALQKGSVVYGKDATNVDCSMNELAQCIARNAYKPFAKMWQMRESREQMQVILGNPVVHRLIRRFYFMADSPFLRVLRTMRFGNSMKFIIEMRNQLVVDAVSEIQGDTYVHYGQAHIKGIVSGLKKNGYQVIERSFLNVKEFDLT